MSILLVGFVFLLTMIVIISFVNEKFIRIPKEIALVLFSFALAVVLKICFYFDILCFEDNLSNIIDGFRFDEFLMEGILCFMLLREQVKCVSHILFSILKL